MLQSQLVKLDRRMHVSRLTRGVGRWKRENASLGCVRPEKVARLGEEGDVVAGLGGGKGPEGIGHDERGSNLW